MNHQNVFLCENLENGWTKLDVNILITYTRSVCLRWLKDGTLVELVVSKRRK